MFLNLLVLLLAVTGKLFAFDYDKCAKEWPRCGNSSTGIKNNVVCQAHGVCQVVGQNCQELPSDRWLRQTLLDSINFYRDRLAKKDFYNATSQYSDMNAVSYSSELEYTSFCHNARCVFSIDECSITHRFPNVHSVTAFLKGEDKDPCNETHLKELVAAPFRLGTTNEPVMFEKVGLAWGKINYVGCTVMVERGYTENQGPVENYTNSLHLLCNVDGNYSTRIQFLATPGGAASACAGGKKN